MKMTICSLKFMEIPTSLVEFSFTVLCTKSKSRVPARYCKCEVDEDNEREQRHGELW